MRILSICLLTFVLSCSEDLDNLPTYNLTISIEGEGEVFQETISDVTPSDHEEVELNAVASENWTFVKWEGDLDSSENPIRVILDEPKNINAKFIRYFDYNQPSYFFKNSDLWLDLNEISGTNQRNNTGSAIADFNNDGYNDIFLAESGNSADLDPVQILLNDGGNNFYSSDLINNNIGTDATRKSIVGDYNLDGMPDIFMADHGHEVPGVFFDFAHPSLMLSNENNTYDFTTLTDLPLEFYHGAASGDFDNDGDLDIFCSTKLFLINDGNGAFSQNTSLFQENSGGIYTVEFYDFNKDGFLDLICGGHSMFDGWGDMPSSKIYYGNGVDFTETRSVTLPNLQEWEVTVDYAIADLNGDGNEEILLVRTGGYVNENNEMINFYNGWRIQVLEKISDDEYIDNTSKFMNNYYGNSQWIVRLRVQDIDNDGKLEIFENDRSNHQTNNPRVWKQNSENFYERINL